uniref:ethanolamine kinase n=1 Tax=Acrobeloides nanus TaxID=290746 RepID=A0A914DML0_9BILA
MGLAAPIFARFHNGIICGYLEGSCLDINSVKEPKIVDAICQAMARMHRIPVEKHQTSEPAIFSKTRDFLDNVPNSYQTTDLQQRFDDYFVKNKVDLEADFKHLSELLKSLHNRIVFCHNDLLVFNILYNSKSEQVHFIDYEYADMNFQLFDIANHFNEYGGVDNPDYSLCPNTDETRSFIQKYLSYYLEHEPSSDEVSRMVEQIPLFEAASHFFWSVWALVQAKNSVIQFDYLEYGITRYQMFRKIIDQK